MSTFGLGLERLCPKKSGSSGPPNTTVFLVSLHNFVIKSVIQLGLFGFLHTNNFRDNRAKLSLTSVI